MLATLISVFYLDQSLETPGSQAFPVSLLYRSSQGAVVDNICGVQKVLLVHAIRDSLDTTNIVI